MHFIGLVYLIGMVLYPAGWGAERVKKMCGKDADIFSPGDCVLGEIRNSIVEIKIFKTSNS